MSVLPYPFLIRYLMIDPLPRSLSAKGVGVVERREASVSVRCVRWFENVDKFEIKHVKEVDFGRSGFEVRMNECEFMVGISLEIEKFIREVMSGGAIFSCIFNVIMDDEIMKTESDIGSGLNDSMHDLCNVFIFLGEDVITKNRLLKACKCH